MDELTRRTRGAFLLLGVLGIVAFMVAPWERLFWRRGGAIPAVTPAPAVRVDSAEAGDARVYSDSAFDVIAQRMGIMILHDTTAEFFQAYIADSTVFETMPLVELRAFLAGEVSAASAIGDESGEVRFSAPANLDSLRRSIWHDEDSGCVSTYYLPVTIAGGRSSATRMLFRPGVFQGMPLLPVDSTAAEWPALRALAYELIQATPSDEPEWPDFERLPYGVTADRFRSHGMEHFLFYGWRELTTDSMTLQEQVIVVAERSEGDPTEKPIVTYSMRSRNDQDQMYTEDFWGAGTHAGRRFLFYMSDGRDGSGGGVLVRSDSATWDRAIDWYRGC